MSKAKNQPKMREQAQVQDKAQAQDRARVEDRPSSRRRNRNSEKQYNGSLINYLLLVMLFLAPFFRGLFFYDELLVAHMYTAVIAGIYFYINRERLRMSKNLMDYSAFGLIIAYLISSFTAVNARDGVGLVMKLVNYFLVYWMIAQTTKETGKMRNVLTTFFLAGLGVALTGIGTAFGTFTFQGAYMDGLIATTIQYHNAAAIYLYATGMIGLFMTNMYQDSILRILSAGASYIVLITATGAGSRGALLVAPIAMFIQFIGLPKEHKEKYFYTVISVLVPLLLTAKSVLTFNQNSAGFYWGMLFLGFGVAALMQFGFDRFIRLEGKVKRNYVISAASLIVVVIAAVLILKGQDVMPTSVSDRLKNFNLSISSVQDRFSFYSDAMKIIKDHPVFGVGGGGWNSIYRSYQSYMYDTTEVHNHFLQVWLESGTVGFVFYILLWIGLILTSIKVALRSQSSEVKAIAWTAFSAALAVGLHSAIDFTLSESAVVIFLWALMGIVRAAEEQNFGQDDQYFFNFNLSPDIRRIYGVTIAVLFFVSSASLYVGVVKSNQAVAHYQGENIDAAISDMESATTFDPFDSDKFTNLSVMYVEKASRKMDPVLLTKSLEAAKSAAKNNSTDSDTQWALAKAYFNTGDFISGVQVAEKTLTLAPFVPDTYLQLAMYYNSAAGEYLRVGKKAEASVVIDKALQIPDMMKAQAAKLTEEQKILFKSQPLDQISPEMQKYLEQARQLKASL